MKVTVLAIVFAFPFFVPSPTPAADDCGMLWSNFYEALSMRDLYSDAVAFDELMVSEDIANGAPQAIIDADVAQCVHDDAMSHDWNAILLVWDDQIHQTHCY